jgi:hypothetical protein
VAPRECPAGWVQFEGYCYLVVNNTAVWDQAEKNCISKGGHLASIHSDSENNFIQSLHSSTSMWIGGTVETNEVGFTYLHNLQGSRVLRLRAFLKRQILHLAHCAGTLLGVPCSTRDSLGKVVATSHNSTSVLNIVKSWNVKRICYKMVWGFTYTWNVKWICYNTMILITKAYRC